MLNSATVVAGVAPRRSLPALARLIVALEVAIGVGALFGGGLLIAGTDGHLLEMTPQLLDATPFRSFLVPGLALFALIGVLPLVAAFSALRRLPIAPIAAVAAGVTLIGWITVEMVALSGAGTLAWALYLVTGTALAILGLTWWRARG